MLAVDPVGETLCVVDRDANRPLVVSAAELSVTAEIEVGEEPHGVVRRP